MGAAASNGAYDNFNEVPAQSGYQERMKEFESKVKRLELAESLGKCVFFTWKTCLNGCSACERFTEDRFGKEIDTRRKKYGIYNEQPEGQI